MRNILARVNKSQKGMVAAAVRTVFAQTTPQDASKHWRQVADNLRVRVPQVSEIMDESEADVLAHMAFAKELWPMIASTNGLERLNRELKRRSDVVGIFPNNNSVIRLLGAILMEQHDEWQVVRKPVSDKCMKGEDTRRDALIARGAGG